MKPSDKNLVKFHCRLEAEGLVFVGARLKLDGGVKVPCPQTIRLFNRQMKVQTGTLMYDIGFCDAEILYVAMSAPNRSFEMEIHTEDSVNSPPLISGTLAK